MHTAIRAVVFDLGGVLIDWDPRHLYRGLFPGDDAAMERFLAEVVTQEWNAEQDAGRTWQEAVDLLTAEHPHHAALIAAFRDRWVEMLGGPIAPTVDVLRELHARGIRLYALTNWSAETFPIARPRFPFLELFDGIVVSGDERVRKPEPEIFRRLLDRYALDPATTLFIDDLEANVIAARGMGMVATHFRDAARLRAELVRLGLLEAA